MSSDLSSFPSSATTSVSRLQLLAWSHFKAIELQSSHYPEHSVFRVYRVLCMYLISRITDFEPASVGPCYWHVLQLEATLIGLDLLKAFRSALSEMQRDFEVRVNPDWALYLKLTLIK